MSRDAVCTWDNSVTIKFNSKSKCISLCAQLETIGDLAQFGATDKIFQWKTGVLCSPEPRFDMAARSHRAKAPKATSNRPRRHLAMPRAWASLAGKKRPRPAPELVTASTSVSPPLDELLRLRFCSQLVNSWLLLLLPASLGTLLRAFRWGDDRSPLLLPHLLWFSAILGAILRHLVPKKTWSKLICVAIILWIHLQSLWSLRHCRQICNNFKRKIQSLLCQLMSHYVSSRRRDLIWPENVTQDTQFVIHSHRLFLFCLFQLINDALLQLFPHFVTKMQSNSDQELDKLVNAFQDAVSNKIR